MAGAKIKFPDTKSCKLGNDAVFCTAERLLGLYNQDSGDPKTAERISKKVRRWFAEEARAKKWAGVQFIPEIQSTHGAGCVLWLPPQQVNVKITITENMYVLKSQDE
jgi:hypothetical protein